jgi:hypothetical protein
MRLYRTISEPVWPRLSDDWFRSAPNLTYESVTGLQARRGAYSKFSPINLIGMFFLRQECARRKCTTVQLGSWARVPPRRTWYFVVRSFLDTFWTLFSGCHVHVVSDICFLRSVISYCRLLGAGHRVLTIVGMLLHEVFWRKYYQSHVRAKHFNRNMIDSILDSHMLADWIARSEQNLWIHRIVKIGDDVSTKSVTASSLIFGHGSLSIFLAYQLSK